MHLPPHQENPVAKEPVKQTMEERVDKIVHYLEKMDRRDRWRTIGGFIKGVIGFVPIIVTLASIWYLYAHGADLMKQIAQEAAKQAASYTQQSGGDVLKQFQNMLKR